MTFVNEWYQTRQVNWRVPIATMIAGAIFEGLSKVSDKGATALAVMVLLAALATKFGGKSVIDTVSTWAQQSAPQRKTPVRKAA
jgi:hypothetical protein